MPRPYSNDLRARVIEAIEAGASRREVAERYELSASVVVLWAQRFERRAGALADGVGLTRIVPGAIIASKHEKW
jgi:transposase